MTYASIVMRCALNIIFLLIHQHIFKIIAENRHTAPLKQYLSE